MQELLKEQELNAQKKAIARRKALQKQWLQEKAENSYRMQEIFAERTNLF